MGVIDLIRLIATDMDDTLLNADGAASPRSWADGTVPGICENSVRAKKALDWIGEMSRDGACAASLCSHDPDVTPQTIKF